MKKVISIFLAAVLFVCSANAQGLFGSLLGGSSSSSSNASSGTGTSLLDLIKGSNTQNVAKSILTYLVGTQSVDLKGDWVYNGAAVSLSSISVLGNIASSVATGSVESKIDDAFAKVGIKPGSATFSFGDNYAFKMMVGRIPINGTWTQEDDKVTLKLGKAFTYLTLDGVVKTTADGCEILFDADKFLAFATKVLSVVGQLSNNSLLGTLTGLSDKVDGLDAGFKLTRLQ